MTLRRYQPLKPSRGTVWPIEVRREVAMRDGGRCVGPHVGMAGQCQGGVELDHVRASGAIGMKSRSTADNGVLLCGFHHRVKTERGREFRPVLLAYLFRYYPEGDRLNPHDGHVDPCSPVCHAVPHG